MANKQMDLAQWVADEVRKQGGDQCSATLSKSTRHKIGIRNQKIETLKEATSSSLELEIYLDQKYTVHTTSSIQRSSLKNFIKNAVDMTRFLTPDSFRSLPDPTLYPQEERIPPNINDPLYTELSPEKKIELVVKTESMAREGTPNLLDATADYSDSHSTLVKVTSNGFSGQKEATQFTLNAEVTVKDGDQGRPEAYYSASTRFFQDLPTAEKVGKTAATRALCRIGQKKIASGCYPVLVENHVVGRLISILYQPLIGRMLQQKNSHLEGQLNQRIGSNLLTLLDDPFIDRGLGSRLWDQEGIKSIPLTIVDKGILKHYYIDNYYGKKLQMPTTTGTLSNLTIPAGALSPEEIQADMGMGIIIQDFLGGNSNPTTGDFSLGIIGQFFQYGGPTKPVNEMNLTGNAKDLFNQLTWVANNPYTYSRLRIPTLGFSGLNFSGL